LTFAFSRTPRKTGGHDFSRAVDSRNEDGL
jgi:hypothetical protein